MKIKIHILFIPIFLLLLSCSKKENIIIRYEKIAVSNSDTLMYHVGFFGEEENASILQDPEFAILNTIERKHNGEIEYIYKSDSSFVGEDYLEIKTARGYNRNGDNTHFSIIKLKVTVTE